MFLHKQTMCVDGIQRYLADVISILLNKTKCLSTSDALSLNYIEFTDV